MSRKFQPVTCTGTNGARLQTGDVVTGSAVRDIVLMNGLCKVTYETKTPDSERGAHTLYRWDGDAYTSAMSAQYGDWTFFVVAVTVTCDRATVIESSPDAAEVAFQWDSLNMTAFDSGGPNALGPADEPIYTAGGVQKKIASTKLVKTIRVERGREGYFVGYHSIPRVGPQLLPTNNKETASGEREFGTGGYNRVYFTSAGVQCLHPDHGNQAGWAAAGFSGSDNRPCWSQHDDLTSSPWNQAGVIALQPAGFPGTQSTGPWWVADLDYQNATTVPFCRYIATVARFNGGSWQFGSGQYGFTVIHWNNEAQDAAGKTHPFQCFIGAFPYVSSNLALEPTTSLRARVAARAPLDFRSSGWADDDESEASTTSGQVRDLMLSTVRGLTPAIAAERGFEPYRENAGPIRRWADKNPAAAPRRFSIRDVGDMPPLTASDTDVAEVTTEFEVVVSYPYDHGWGAAAALSLDDVIERDARQIDQAIGTEGYFLLDTSNGGDARVVTLGQHREDGDACRFLVLRLSVSYWRSYP